MRKKPKEPFSTRPRPSRTPNRPTIDYDRRYHFVFTVIAKNDFDAYEELLEQSQLQDDRVYRAALRGYRRLFRSLEQPFKEWIEQKIQSTVPDNPMYVVNMGLQPEVGRTWLFFGAYVD